MNRNKGRGNTARQNRSAGVTMVELLVAVVLLAVVAMTAWFVYAVNQRAFRQGREKMLVQQNASWCLEAIARDIRQAWRVDYVSPTRIVLYEVGGKVLSTWEMGTVDGENRVIRNSLAMSPEECTALVFSIENPDSSTVGVELELMDDAENRVRLLNKTSLRNHEAFGT